MNAWRWLGISIFLVTVGVLTTNQFTALKVFAGDKDAKKVVVSADPDKAEIEPGKSKAVDIKLKRGKDAKEDAMLTVEVDPKDKGVTAKLDTDKLTGDKATAKLSVDSKSDTTDGAYKIIVKSKSKGSDDSQTTFTLTVKKAAVVVPTGDAWKFTAFDSKKSFFQEQYTETVQKMTVQGQQVEQKQEQWFLIQWTPLEKAKDNWVVEQQIVGVKMNIDIGGNKIKYDSTDLKNKPKNPMTDFFEQLTKQKLKFTITPDLKIDKIENREEFIKGLSEINPQMQGLLKAILSDKALTKMAEPAWYAFPEKGMVPDKKSWEKVSELDLGPIGKYKTTFDFTYKGADGKTEKVGVKTKLEYSAPADKGGLPFVIKDAKLTGNSTEGDAVFSREAGRFISSTLKMTLKGDLKIEVGNMTTDVTLDQTQTATSKTFDERPAEWADKK